MGGRIKYYRDAAGMSQLELANAVGLSQSSIGHFELDIRLPSVSTLLKLYEVLDCDLHWILTGEEYA